MDVLYIDLFEFVKHRKNEDYVHNVFCRGFVLPIHESTRLMPSIATWIGHTYTNANYIMQIECPNNVFNGSYVKHLCLTRTMSNSCYNGLI